MGHQLYLYVIHARFWVLVFLLLFFFVLFFFTLINPAGKLTFLQDRSLL